MWDISTFGSFDKVVKPKKIRVEAELGIESNYRYELPCAVCKEVISWQDRYDTENIWGELESFCFNCYAEQMEAKNTCWFRNIKHLKELRSNVTG